MPKEEIIGKTEFISRHDEFKDTLPRYYASISGIIYNKGRLYFTDDAAGKIYVTDGDLNYLLDFGSKGQGPDELRNFGRLVVDGEDKVVADYLSRKFVVFDNSGDIKTQISPIPHGILNTNFLAEENEITFYDSRSDSVVTINSIPQVLRGFPFPWEAIGLKKPKTGIEMSLFKYNDNLLALIHDVYPALCLFDSKGDFIYSLNLSDLDLLKGMMVKQQSFGTSGMSLVFFNDGKLVEDKLYTIIGTRNNEGEDPYYNHLIAFSISNQELAIDFITELNQSRWYTSFDLIPKEKSIVAFDASARHIDIYSLK